MLPRLLSLLLASCGRCGWAWLAPAPLACPGGKWSVRLFAREERWVMYEGGFGKAKVLLAREEGGPCVLACPGREWPVPIARLAIWCS